MPDLAKRAHVTTHSIAPDTWDAGLHAESEAGRIDVGLSVEPRAVGLVVEAPGLGVLKLAFDVTPEGATSLARATRRLPDGRDAGLVVVDEGAVLRLEGELARAGKKAEEERGYLETERNEARDRADIMAEERDEVRAELAKLQRQLSEVTATLAQAREERLATMGELDRARAERREADARLEAQVDQLRRERDEARAIARKLHQRLEGVDRKP